MLLINCMVRQNYIFSMKDFTYTAMNSSGKSVYLFGGSCLFYLKQEESQTVSNYSFSTKWTVGYCTEL